MNLIGFVALFIGVVCLIDVGRMFVKMMRKL